jgi:hypothetical protein
VRPQDDLYRFVGGNWLAHTEIPADRSNYGSFIILDDQAQEEVKDLIVAASKQPNRAPGSDAQKVGDFYNAYMDTARVESLGSTPLPRSWRASTPSPRRATWRATSALAAHRCRAAVLWFSSPTTRTPRCTSAPCTRTASPCRPGLLPQPGRQVRRIPRQVQRVREQMLARAGERNAKSAAARIARWRRAWPTSSGPRFRTATR